MIGLYRSRSDRLLACKLLSLWDLVLGMHCSKKSFGEVSGIILFVLSIVLLSGHVRAADSVADSDALNTNEEKVSLSAESKADAVETNEPLVTEPDREKVDPSVSQEQANSPLQEVVRKGYKSDSSTTGSTLLSMVVGLALVVGLIAAVAWGMKRFSSMTPAGGKHIKVLSASAVGTRERIALVEVGDKKILVGITPQTINTLHVFDSADIPEAAPVNSEFSKKLQAMMSRGSDIERS